jgi:hypothetical protein
LKIHGLTIHVESIQMDIASMELKDLFPSSMTTSHDLGRALVYFNTHLLSEGKTRRGQVDMNRTESVSPANPEGRFVSRRSSRRWIAAAAVCVVGGVAGIGIAGATSTPTSPTVVTAPAGSPVPNPPVDSGAVPSNVQKTFPAAPAAGASNITQAQAETEGLKLGDTPPTSAPGSGAPSSAPVWAKFMTYGAATQILGDGGNQLVSTSTPVWIVTVESPKTTDGGPGSPGTVKSSYTAILDAATGQFIDMCTGCSTLAPSGS